MKNITIPKITVNDIKDYIQSIDRKTLIKAGIYVGGFLAFVLFIFLPLSLQAKKLNNEVRNMKQKITQANAKIAKIPEMTKQKEMFGARIKKLREEFFESNETDQLIEVISTAANESGVKISATRPSPKISELPAPFDKKYIPVSYELVVEGSYHAIGKFVNLFENYPKSFAVHDLQIGKQGESQEAQIQGILTLTAFIKHPTAS